MATKRWIGNAAKISDAWTISLSGTVISQTYTMTINGKSIAFTATGTDTVTTILAGIATLWNSSNNPAEFQELTAVAYPIAGPYSSVVITGDTPGKPSVISVATSGGATFAISNTTAATGPNDFVNAANWSTGSAPANGDVLIFDYGAVDVKYGLSTSLTTVTVQVKDGFTGAIGLPSINSDATVQGLSYFEYRPTALTLAGGTALINSKDIRRCNLAFGANTTTVQVTNTGGRIENGVPVVLVTGGNSSSKLSITKGDVGVAFYGGTTAQFSTIQTSFQKSLNGDVSLYVGSGATLTTVSIAGGTVFTNSAVTTLTVQAAGGTLTVLAGAITTLNVQGGTVYYNSTGTLTNCTVSGKGVLSFDKDVAAKTVTNAINLYGDNSWVIDNQKAVNSGTLSVVINQTTKMNVQHGSGNIATVI